MKLFKFLFIPLTLVFGYLILISYPYFFSKINNFDRLGILSLIEEKSIDTKKTGSSNKHLLKGEKITGEAKSSENNLGILLFRFSQLSAIVSDRVIFRIKEKGEGEWYYENEYNANQFQRDQYFTFGFPLLKNSKNKIYFFEIESLSGTYKNAIGESAREPHVALVHIYTKSDLMNFNTLVPFIFKKFAYVADNVNFLQNRMLLIIFILLIILTLYLKRKKRIVFLLIKYLTKHKKNYRKLLKLIIGENKSDYLLFEKKIIKPLKNLSFKLVKSNLYLSYLNTSIKRRLLVAVFIFLFAFLYRFSNVSIDQLGVSSFYSGLGGQGDYDQFIRAATCAVRTFCPAILGQNFLIESSVLGTFYEIFGFTGGIKTYLYLMIILSSIVATLPYLILSRKTLFTIGGIIGSLYLSTSDYLTHMALNLPPDNGSLFTFSIFFIIYLLTIHIGTIRWLLFFGAFGAIDGLNKLIFLINDLAVFILFIPAFFFEKVIKIKKPPFVKGDPKLIFYSMLPFLVFFVIYLAWEYIVEIKFGTPYYFRSLIEGGTTYASSTNEATGSVNDPLLRGNILEKAYYYAGSYIVMTKRVIANAGLTTILLAPIFIGLLFAMFTKLKFSITRLISVVIFSVTAILILELFRNDYMGVQRIGQYVYAWGSDIYINVFLFTTIIFLFLLNFKYQAIKLALPIIPYIGMIIILSKNAPWERMLAHIIVWSIILFSFLIDWILSSSKKDYVLKRLWVGPFILILFTTFYMFPKVASMTENLYSGTQNFRDEIKYLRWVNSELPPEAIVLAGGKSDLVIVAENINRPIIYNSLWTGALLIKPKEIPGVKPTDFSILSQTKISEIPGITPSDFNILAELKNKENFAKNKYLILEDDIYLWQGRVMGVEDNLFATASGTLLNPNNYSIKAYKFNSALKKSIYELKFKEIKQE